MNYLTHPALRHLDPALETSAAVALAARKAAGVAAGIPSGIFYSAILWNAAGVADVIDSYGTVKKVVTVAGAIYPVQNCGVQVNGNTTLVQGDFLVLYS